MKIAFWATERPQRQVCNIAVALCIQSQMIALLKRLSLKKRDICIYTEHIEFLGKSKTMSPNVDRDAKHELEGWVRPLRSPILRGPLALVTTSEL